MKILITGTSTGLGFGLATHYLSLNHDVYGISRRSNALLNRNTQFAFLSQDITEFEEVKINIPVFLKDIDSLDLVILNAGILNSVKDMKDTSLTELKHVMDVNVWANKTLIDSLFKNIKRIQQVVAISSGISVSGSRGWNAYAISKASLNVLMRLYSAEHKDTHFCALAPGLVDTGMQDYISGLPDDERFPQINILKKYKDTPRMPHPEEAAKLVSDAINKATRYESGNFIDLRDI